MNEPTDRRHYGADQASGRADERFDERFDDALRAWAARPPRTPARQAARRIAERLPTRRRTPQIRRLAVAAALVAGLGAAALLRWIGAPGNGTTLSPTEATPTVTSLRAAAPAPDGDVLVIDLDPQTTLYLNLDGPGGD